MKTTLKLFFLAITILLSCRDRNLFSPVIPNPGTPPPAPNYEFQLSLKVTSEEGILTTVIAGLTPDSTGNMYVIDSSSNIIKKYTSTGALSFSIYQSNSRSYGDITLKDNYFYILDPSIEKIHQYTTSGSYIATHGTNFTSLYRISIANGYLGTIDRPSIGYTRYQLFSLPSVTPTNMGASWTWCIGTDYTGFEYESDSRLYLAGSYTHFEARERNWMTAWGQNSLPKSIDDFVCKNGYVYAVCQSENRMIKMRVYLGMITFYIETINTLDLPEKGYTITVDDSKNIYIGTKTGILKYKEL